MFCVIFVNEEALAHWGLLRQNKKKIGVVSPSSNQELFYLILLSQKFHCHIHMLVVFITILTCTSKSSK